MPFVTPCLVFCVDFFAAAARASPALNMAADAPMGSALTSATCPEIAGMTPGRGHGQDSCWLSFDAVILLAGRPIFLKWRRFAPSYELVATLVVGLDAVFRFLFCLEE